MLRAGPLLIALLAALLLAACGGDSESGDENGFEKVLSQVNELRGKERTRELVRLAKREGGSLEFYTSLASDAAAGVAKEFEDTYDMEVSVYRATGETVLQRVSEESKADFRGADLVDSNAPGLQTLARDDILFRYRSPYVAGLLRGSAHDAWTAHRFNKFVVSWNTDRVPRGEQPRSWEDLADARWKGKLAMEAGDFDWYKTLREYWVEREGKSEAEADRLFETMARHASVLKGHPLMAELVGAGEYEVGASNYSYQVQEAIREGVNIAWKPVVEPVISRAQGVGLVKGARHPATAILFLDWLLSDGQKAMTEYDIDPARRDLVTTPNVREIQVDIEDLVAEQEEWEDRYDRLVGLGKKGEEEN